MLILSMSGGAPLGGLDPIYLFVTIGPVLLSMAVSGMLRSRFAEYSQIPLRATGAQVAEAMLRQNGIRDVQVLHVPGELTDHYDPVKKTVNLSEVVYHRASVAAAAVAAHEVGHAIQHRDSYAWLKARSMIVPAVQFSSNLQPVLMILAVIGFMAFKSTLFLWLMVLSLGVTTLFALVTLPVEFDASRRAMVWLQQSGLAAQMQQERAKNALFWAAMTYVVGALAALAQLGYWVMQLLAARANSSDSR